jgi:hypothetical protein
MKIVPCSYLCSDDFNFRIFKDGNHFGHKYIIEIDTIKNYIDVLVEPFVIDSETKVYKTKRIYGNFHVELCGHPFKYITPTLFDLMRLKERVS